MSKLSGARRALALERRVGRVWTAARIAKARNRVTELLRPLLADSGHGCSRLNARLLRTVHIPRQPKDFFGRECLYLNYSLCGDVRRS